MSIREHKMAFERKAINDNSAVNAKLDRRDKIHPSLGIGERIIHSSSSESSESELEEEELDLDNELLDNQDDNFNALDQFLLENADQKNVIEVDDVDSVDYVDEWLNTSNNTMTKKPVNE